MNIEEVEAEEAELQAILDKAPEKKALTPERCVFCDEVADQLVEAEEVGLASEDIEDESFVWVCAACFYSQSAECIPCAMGEFCMEHKEHDLFGLIAAIALIGDPDGEDEG